MPLETFNPPVAASPGTSQKPEIKLNETEFGDGYTQTSGDGRNYIRKVYDLKWETLTQAQAAAMEAFLTAKGATTPFYYRHPFTPAPIKVTCKEWGKTDQAAGLCSFNAVFRQSFMVAS